MGKGWVVKKLFKELKEVELTYELYLTKQFYRISRIKGDREGKERKRERALEVTKLECR